MRRWAAMTTSNVSKDHEAMNDAIESVLISRLWICRREERHTDIVAFLPGFRGVWALESERRCNAYWIRRNALRNERNGAWGIVFVTESDEIVGRVRRIVGSLAETIRKKTVVVSIKDFTSEFVATVMERRSDSK